MTEKTSSEVPEAAPGPPPSENAVWIPGGTFLMGSDAHYPEEAPAHKVSVRGFWMDRHTVTNREFARFALATGHVTLAERPADPRSTRARSRSCSAVVGRLPQDAGPSRPA
jgi:formylglycine-generating enzyme required for sulfatase activity